MKTEKITLKEAAKLANVSPSLIYHYIQKGLLAKPDRIPNRKKGRGALSVYPKSIIESILIIKSKLKVTHSLSQVKEELSIKDKDKVVVEKLETLLYLAKQKKSDGSIFKDKLQNLSGFVFSPSLASTCFTGEKIE